MKINLQDKLWDLANLITLFSLAQGLAYLYALKDQGFVDQVCKYWLGIILLIFTLNVLWTLALWWCHGNLRTGLDPDEKNASTKVKWVQIIIIWVLGISASLLTLQGCLK